MITTRFHCFVFLLTDKECSTVVDIAFVIDSSGSIGRSNWERMKRFIKSLVSKLDVSPSATHVAAVAYSTNPEVVMRFNDFQGTDQVNLLIDRMRWQRGFTYTDKALILANSNLFQTSTGMRFSVLKVGRVVDNVHSHLLTVWPQYLLIVKRKIKTDSCYFAYINI